MNSIRLLENQVQHYSWGSPTRLAEFLGLPAPSPRPVAELWMGAHPRASSTLVGAGPRITLAAAIAADPEAWLGRAVAERFGGRLPFLFKVIAAERPLSLQVHPRLAHARAGFAREEALGIPVDAPQRSYRDAEAKAEINCALTPFWAMNGFRPLADLSERLDRLRPSTLATEIAQLRQDLTPAGLHRFLAALLTLPRERQAAVATELAAAAGREADPAVSRWVHRLHARHPRDIGVIAPVLLNTVHLAPGEALYTPPGQPHAYLEGMGVELMANSDNVVRAALTDKHVDVAELLATVNCEPAALAVLHPEPTGLGEQVYRTPCPAFSLAVIELAGGGNYRSPAEHGLEILLVTQGDVVLRDDHGGPELALHRGQSVAIPAVAGAYDLRGVGQVYQATTPSPAA